MIDAKTNRNSREWKKASRLLLRFRDTGSDNDLRALMDWLDDDQQRHAIVRSLGKAWDIMDVVARHPEFKSWRGQTHPDSRLNIKSGLAEGSGRLGAWGPVLIAASLLLAIFSGLIWSGFIYSPHEEIIASNWGERRTVTLADGTSVLLDAATRLEVNYSPSRRDVRLSEGQAHFKVAPDPRRPFHVRAADHDVRALGTDFNVGLTPSRLDVSLLGGSVEISRLRPREIFFGLHTSVEAVPLTTLKPGDQFESLTGKPARTKRFNPAEVTAWERGRLIFDSLPARDAAALVNRYSQRPVLIHGTVADSYISGTFNAGDGLPFARALVAIYPGTVMRVSSERIELTEK